MKRIRPAITAAAALVVVAVPTTANAAVRTGSIIDPQGDAVALSGPALDIQSVAVSYDDTAGTLHVVSSYYGDVADSATDSVNVSMPVVPNKFDYASMQWQYYSGTVTAMLGLYGVSGSLPGTATLSGDMRTVTMDFGPSDALKSHDWQRVFGPTGSTSDTFTTFWFDGYSEPTYGTPTGTVAPVNTAAPATGPDNSNVGVSINDGAQYTNDPDVTLSVVAPSGADRLRVSNDGGFRTAKALALKPTVSWKLDESGAERLPKTVYLRFGSQWGWDPPITDDIILDQTNPIVASATLVRSGPTARSTSVSMAASAKSRTYKVRIRAKDATSGVGKVQFALSKRHPSKVRKFKRISSYTGAKAPRFVRVRDRAGNYSRWRSIARND